MTKNSTDWCILRMAPSRTLTVASSLADAGFEVWTPVDTIRQPRPRSKIEREVVIPLISGFVFARYEQVADLLTLSRSPSGMAHQVWDAEQRRMVNRGIPFFSLFTEGGRCPRVTDASLAPLRALETRLQVRAERRREAARRRGPPPRYAAGDTFHLPDGPYQGLELVVVEANDGKMVKLTHPGWLWIVEVCAWSLSEVQLKGPRPEQGPADRIGMAS